jgi:uncharacterized protein
VTADHLAALLSVQDLDTALDQHRRRRAGLQERAELAGIDGRLGRVEDRLSAASVLRDEVAEREEALEADLGATEARRTQVSKRLYGGTVSATRDLQAMAADVESLTARATKLEEQAFEVMEEREPLDAEVTAIQREKEHLLDARAEVEGRLSVAEGEIDREIALDTGRRAEAVAQVPSDLLTIYERLRTRLGGIGAARLVGPSCTGCHLKLPAQELDRVRREPPDALVYCDQCGRILIR